MARIPAAIAGAIRRHYALAAGLAAALLGAAVLPFVPDMADAGPRSLAAAALALALVRYLAAVAAVVGVQVALNWVDEGEWALVHRGIRGSPIASGIYFGLRFVALALLAWAFLG